MVHAIEACCAYGKHPDSLLLSEDHFRRIVNTFTSFDDPVQSALILADPELFEFVVYMYRTQMDKQGEVWWMPIGRMTRLFGNPAEVPVCHADFLRRFGITLRQWLQLSFAIQAGTMGEKTKFSREYAGLFAALGIKQAVVDRFLGEVSRTPDEIGEAYRLIRYGNADTKTWNPRTWSQHRPQLSRTPLIALPRGFVAPVEAYVVDLFGDSLFRRLVAEDSEQVRREIGRRYQQYVEDMIRYHLPTTRLWTSTDLEVEGERSADFALDLSDCVLVIECKAVIFDQDVVTRKAVLQSGAINKIVDGYEQTVRTAMRVQAGAYKHLGIPNTKPRIGLVATLGAVPGANQPAVLSHALNELQVRGVKSEAVQTSLAAPLQAFHGFALEHLMVCLKHEVASVTQLFAERSAKHPLSMGDWQHELARKLQAGKPHDIAFWKNPGWELLEELGVNPGTPDTPNPS